MKKIIFVLAIFSHALVSAQLSSFKGMSMRSIGPGVTSGRVTAIDVAPNQMEMYVGAASGGVWKSESAGVRWSPIFDDQPNISIGAIKVSSTHPDVVWVGTGEGNPRNSQNSGKGIYRSLDAGKTWKCMGLEKTKAIHRICLDRQDNAWVAAMGSAWGPNTERGVYFFNAQTSSWTSSLFVNDSTGCADLIMDPNNDQKLLAAMWQYQRKPWTFQSGGKGSGLYITHDGGKNWKRLTEKEGLPKGNLGRIGIAIAPSDSRIVYAMIEAKKTGLYRSDNGGANWYLVTENGVDDRPFYYSEFYVDPQNPNHLIYLHSIVSESIDGGKTWKTLLPYWGVHPDHHAFWWNPVNVNEMWEGNDGGLNVSRDGGKNWTFIPNLPLGQFYHVNYDHATPYNVYGGLQDNGTWKGPAYVWHSDGILDSDWQELYFGDGFDAVPDPSDENWVYVLSQGGDLARVHAPTGQEQSIRPVHPEGAKLRFHWNTAIAADPHDQNGIYLGSQFLHHSSDHGQTWSIISPDLTTNDPSKQEAYKSGGLTTDATSAENHCTIISIMPHPSRKNEIWVGTDDGQLQRTTNGGVLWENISAGIKQFPKHAWIPQIVINDNQPDEIWVVVNNYRLNDWTPYLFHTTDNGKHWENCLDKKNVQGHCLSVCPDLLQTQLIFLGTDEGLYVSMDDGEKWEKWKYQYPSVATQDLKIHPQEHDLIIGTFGRGIYILDDIRPMRTWIEQSAMPSDTILLFPPKEGIQANYKRHNGQRFYADLVFQGQSRSSEVKVGCIIKQNKKKEGEEKEKMKIAILDTKGDTIRYFEQAPDSFVTYVSWGFDRDGMQYPTRAKREKKKERPGGGWNVAPGKYTMHIAYGKQKAQTEVEVLPDPRFPWDQKVYERQWALYQDWKKVIKDLDDEVEKIKESRELMDWSLQAIKYLPDSVQKQWKTQADTLHKYWNQQMEVVFMPEGRRGHQDYSRYINGRIWTPYSLIASGSAMPGKNAEVAIEELRKDVEEWKLANQKIWQQYWNPFAAQAPNHLLWPEVWRNQK